MLRVAIGSGLLSIGYLLAYAAFAGGGQYALRPWDALAAPPSASVGPTGSLGVRAVG
jgi:hypothetical protein